MPAIQSGRLVHTTAIEWKHLIASPTDFSNRGNLHFLRVALFDVHIFELTGLENFATLEALDKFRVLIARNNLDARMTARLFHILVLRIDGRVGHLNRSHTETLPVSGAIPSRMRGILERLESLSSTV
jgi:hypothetical protein